MIKGGIKMKKYSKVIAIILTITVIYLSMPAHPEKLWIKPPVVKPFVYLMKAK